MGIFNLFRGHRNKQATPRFHTANVKAIPVEWKLKDSQHAGNALSTWGGSSLQGILHTIEARTVAVRAVDRSEAIFPDGYEADDKGDPIALVDGDGRALSTVDGRTLELAGYSLGSYVACAVVRFGYYGEDIVNLNLLMTDFAVAHQDEIRRHFNMSKMLGIELPIGLDYACVRIDAEDWPLPHHSGVVMHSASTRTLPVPAGSKASAHIELLLDGVVVRELSARGGNSYRTISRHVGENPFVCASLPDNDIGTNKYKIVLGYK